jgi:hypothetical protein
MAMISNLEWALELPPLGAHPAIPFVNPLTKLWREFDANSALSTSFPEYIKLAHIAMIHLLGSIEDERTFSSLTFLKDKLRNRLEGNHLGIAVGIHAQSMYSLKTFPYNDCFKQWVHSAEQYCYGTCNTISIKMGKSQVPNLQNGSNRFTISCYLARIELNLVEYILNLG